MNTMAVNIIILSALFFSCVTMSIALGIAWRSFRMPRHALTWSVAFGLSALQSAANLAAVLAGRPPQLMIIAFVMVIAPSPFVAIGARQRAGLRPHVKIFVAAALATFLFLIVTAPIPALHPLSYPSATLYSALCLLACAHALVPASGEAEPAEWAMFGATLLLALVELAVALWTGLYLRDPADQQVTATYHAILAIALPPAVVAAGVSALLLLASDLAVELRRLAARDPLTGVFNRRGFHEAAMRALAASRKQRIAAAVALCDIDHFKAINDRHGHGVGDETLLHVCRELSRGVMACDVIARVGGEEFALLLMDGHGAAATAERIRNAVAAGLAIEGGHVPVTISFGLAPVAMTGPIDEVLASALDAADRALYRSKLDGRDRLTIFVEDDNAPPPPALHGALTA